MNKPILCSEILSALTQPKRAIALYQGGRTADTMIRQKQTEFVNAKKFVIDANMIEHAWNMSLAKPSVLLEIFEDAKIPFDNLWIEWNEHTRQDIMKNYFIKNNIKYKNHNEYPDNVGYHIYKHKNKLDEEYFIYENWWFTGGKFKNLSMQETGLKDKFFTPTMAFTITDFITNWEDELARIDILNELPKAGRCKNEDELKIQAFSIGTSLLGRSYSFKYIPKKFLITLEEKQKLGDNDEYVKYIKKLIKYNNNHEFNCFKDLCYTLALAQSASMHWSIPEWKFKEGYTPEEMAQHQGHAMITMEGDARFLISLFALMNQNIHDKTLIKPNNKIIHTKLGKRVPRNDFYVLNVNISDYKVRKIYKSKFTGKGNPKREHDRRGHFRHLTDNQGNLKKKIWIKSQTVGNRELGRIDKDYKLT